jgi:hypothetical protein
MLSAGATRVLSIGATIAVVSITTVVSVCADSVELDFPQDVKIAAEVIAIIAKDFKVFICFCCFFYCFFIIYTA